MHLTALVAVQVMPRIFFGKIHETQCPQMDIRVLSKNIREIRSIRALIRD